MLKNVPRFVGLHSKLWRRCFPLSSNILHHAQQVHAIEHLAKDDVLRLEFSQMAHSYCKLRMVVVRMPTVRH